MRRRPELRQTRGELAVTLVGLAVVVAALVWLIWVLRRHGFVYPMAANCVGQILIQSASFHYERRFGRRGGVAFGLAMSRATMWSAIGWFTLLGLTPSRGGWTLLDWIAVSGLVGTLAVTVLGGIAVSRRRPLQRPLAAAPSSAG